MMSNDLRPTKLNKIVGQKSTVQQLKTSIAAARSRGKPLNHVLLDGPPGLGKTTIAQCIANELKMPFFSCIASALSDIPAAMEFVLQASKPSVFFIDEVHQLSKAVEEFLYPVLEDSVLDVRCGDESIGQLDVPPSTFIAATTRSGDLTMPFRDRFPIRHHLEYYTINDLCKIIKTNAKEMGLKLHSSVPQYIAAMSRGTPRVANNRLMWLRDCAWKSGIPSMTIECTALAMSKIGLDGLGLDKRDRKVLEVMRDTFHSDPVGIQSLASSTGLSQATVEDEIEPFLLFTGLIARTPRGRQLTNKGKNHLSDL